MTAFDELANLWPDGSPSLRERGYFELLGEEKRQAVIARLRAIQQNREGASAQELANELNIAVSGFYALANRFSRDPSITTLVAGLRPRRGRSRGETLTEGVIIEVRELIATHPHWPRERVLEHIQQSHEKPPAPLTLRPVIDRLLVADEQERLGGKNGFGRRTLVCSCPIVFRFPSAIGSEAAAIAGFVFDLATGWCLANATSIHADTAISIACERAAETIAEMDFVEKHVEAPTIEVQPFAGASAMMWHIDRLQKLGVACDTHSTRERSLSTRAIELLGSPLGSLHFHPRMEPTSISSGQLKSVDVAEFLGAILHDELERKEVFPLSGKTIAGTSMALVERALRELA